MPADVGIPGGFTPTPIPPITWSGSWTDPAPTSTSTSSSSSEEPTQTCALVDPDFVYSWPDDPENADWEDEGTDPDMKKRGELDLRANSARSR